jgi:hypothetical protein
MSYFRIEAGRVQSGGCGSPSTGFGRYWTHYSPAMRQGARGWWDVPVHPVVSAWCQARFRSRLDFAHVAGEAAATERTWFDYVDRWYSKIGYPSGRYVVPNWPLGP